MHIHGRFFSNTQLNDSGIHIRCGHKAAAADLEQNFRLGVILHGRTDSAALARAGLCTQTLCRFFLYHNRDARDGQTIFQKLHDDRRRDVIRQVRTHSDLFPVKFFFDDAVQVDLHHVVVDDLHVIAVGKRFV